MLDYPQEQDWGALGGLIQRFCVREPQLFTNPYLSWDKRKDLDKLLRLSGDGSAFKVLCKHVHTAVERIANSLPDPDDPYVQYELDEDFDDYFKAYLDWLDVLCEAAQQCAS